MPQKILIVEDDRFLVQMLRLGLEREGFEISASQGGDAMKLFREHRPDLVILDLMLPDITGEELCRSLRAEAQVPIIVLTCRDDVKDKVSLFRLGADDYVVKPFDFEELLARIQARFRETGRSATRREVRFLDIVVNPITREVRRAGVTVKLTAKEFDLLYFLIRNPRQVFSKDALLEKVWGYDDTGGTNTVEVHVGHLRSKLGEPPVLQTVRGAGYSLRLDST